MQLHITEFKSWTPNRSSHSVLFELENELVGWEEFLILEIIQMMIISIFASTRARWNEGINSPFHSHVRNLLKNCESCPILLYCSLWPSAQSSMCIYLARHHFMAYTRAQRMTRLIFNIHSSPSILGKFVCKLCYSGPSTISNWIYLTKESHEWAENRKWMM